MLSTGKFSLYSTDTEEQVVSMSRGLDRCAALLKSLLSPEKQPPPAHAPRLEREGGVHQATAGGRLSDKLSRKPTITKATHKTGKTSSLSADGRTRNATSAEPPFPGSSKHVRHPNACSTPRKDGSKSRHVRSATEPRLLGELQAANKDMVMNNGHQPHCGLYQSEETHGNAATSQRQSRRRHLKAHRRLNSEPRHKRSRSAEGHRHGLSHRQDDNHGPVKSSEGHAPSNFICHDHGLHYSNVPNFYLYPHHAPHVAPHHAPHLAPHHTPHLAPHHTPHLAPHHAPHLAPCCTAYGAHFSSLPPSATPTCTHCQPPKPLPEAWPPKGGVYPSSGPFQRCNSAPSARTGPTDDVIVPPTTSGSSDPSPFPSDGCHGVQGIQLLTQEMMTALQYNIDETKKMVGENSGVHQLETMEYSLKLYCSQLSLQCQKLLLCSGRPPSPSSSLSSLANHWQTQLRQLEEEKSQLLERLIASETAYSEVKGHLDHSTKGHEDLRREIESSRSQVVGLKKEVEQTNRLLTQIRIQKNTAEEKLQGVQLSSQDSLKEERAKNEDLQRQVDILSKELVRLKQDHLKECAHLSQTQVSLDRAKEEIQLMKLSLSEKETQLLQSHDHQLGLRQCLAYFLSDLRLHHHSSSSSSSSSSQSGDSYYTVSQSAVQRFQSLVSDGAIEQFLTHYTGREKDSSRKERHTVSLQDTLNESQDVELGQSSPLSSLSHSDSRSSSTVAHSRQRREKETERDSTLSMLITPLEGGRQATERLDSDSTITGTSFVSGDIDLHEERLVEGSSVKDQPRSSKSHDFTTRSEDLNHLKAHRDLPPKGGDEVKGRWVQSPSRSTLSSLRTSITGTSCRTTASEAEFRSDLASLDADIARLQMQFRVANLT